MSSFSFSRLFSPVVREATLRSSGQSAEITLSGTDRIDRLAALGGGRFDIAVYYSSFLGRWH